MDAKPVKKRSKSKTPTKPKFLMGGSRRRFVVIILIIAIIGGGLAVYKSFAATPSWTYNVASNNMIGTSGASNSPCKATKVTDAAKNSNTVINLTCGGNGAPATASAVGASIAPTMIGQPFRLCAMMSGSGNINLNLSIPGTLSQQSVSTAATVSGGYAYTCTAKTLTAQKTGPITATVSASRLNTNVRVASMTIEQMPPSYASTASVKAPAPTK